MSPRRLYFIVLSGMLAASLPSYAWDIETNVGLTQRAAVASHFDAWLRAHGLAAGLRDGLALEMRYDANRKEHRAVLDVDRALLQELSSLDAALGIMPDISPAGARQPAIPWLLAGAALEGARIERIRNHFVDPRHGFGPSKSTGLAEGSEAAHVAGLGAGNGSIRGMLTGASFDGTGERADRWIDAPASRNPMSRQRMLDELYAAATAKAAATRAAALARALVCAGSILHVLEAVGDPSHARGDFAVSYGTAGAPFARSALSRYGLSVPAPTDTGITRTHLASFITATDGSGLADEVGRNFVSPGTMPGTSRALAEPNVVAGPEPEGFLPGTSVQHLVAYHRTPSGPRFTLPTVAIPEAVDVLLPRIAGDAMRMLDFLTRGSLELKLAAPAADAPLRISVVNGPLALGPGKIELFIEDKTGARRRVQGGATEGTHASAPIADFELGTAAVRSGTDTAVVIVFRGVDENGEPLVLSAQEKLFVPFEF